MKSRLLSSAISLALILPAFSPAALAQSVAAVDSAPVVASLPTAAPSVPSGILPSNTEILLSMNEELSTKKNDEGDTFYMTVVHNVVHDGQIVIPKGARATGEITWRTGKGAFGKSGKMEIAIRYVEVGGTRVPLVGTFRQEGEGNTVATVAGVIAVGVFAVFITGKTGRIPAGRELSVRTKDELAFAIPPGAPTVQAAAMSNAAPTADVAASAAEDAETTAPAVEGAAPASEG